MPKKKLGKICHDSAKRDLTEPVWSLQSFNLKPRDISRKIIPLSTGKTNYYLPSEISLNINYI